MKIFNAGIAWVFGLFVYGFILLPVISLVVFFLPSNSSPGSALHRTLAALVRGALCRQWHDRSPRQFARCRDNFGARLHRIRLFGGLRACPTPTQRCKDRARSHHDSARCLLPGDWLWPINYGANELALWKIPCARNARPHHHQPPTCLCDHSFPDA